MDKYIVADYPQICNGGIECREDGSEEKTAAEKDSSEDSEVVDDGRKAIWQTIRK